MFSDTIIIFTLSDTIEDLCSILVHSSQFFADALHKCVPLRGGIAHGDFLFNFDLGLFLGVPLVDAYHIGEEAQWLGIVVDETAAKKSKQFPGRTYDNSPTVIEWDLPLKGNKTKKAFVINWPKIFKRNFANLPVSLSDFFSPFERLFGPFDKLKKTKRQKYINTVDFINHQLS